MQKWRSSAGDRHFFLYTASTDMKKWTMRFRQIDKARFEELRNGIKAIETRAASVKYQPIMVDDEIKFVCGRDSFTKTIAKKYHWPSVDVMVKEIPFKKVMPAVNSIEEMKKRYSSYPG